MKVAFATGADDIEEITDLINRVYADGEAGLWLPGAERTTIDEVTSIIRGGELVIARDDDGRIAGAVRAVRLTDEAGDFGEFGMLVADPGRRNTGIGRDLVAFAEQWARDQGLTRMQLELLVPREWQHPVKEFLRAWYTRLGYRLVRTGRLEEGYPHLQPLLATPCDFLIYHKDL
ncbi:GNAT family N-acetyltransferase [Actinoplanes sp. TBRC 11911]|uniref:GNAT family N-acetyltransferase n=1 Tax=Actinoplanes sp. TBRC 11911 TaxID=2729386 RepID=UPI00145C6EE2|nr:GNAT family N-acetyltransferase [Actinoplanes sp. TBRC 11911]NMO53280.1 GNAT family N-acetyltransferase [Actinoplanes sp. TBRC 11911]